MFSVKHNECVGFESRWKVKKVSSVGSTQTAEFSTSDMTTTTTEKKDMEVQTDVLPTRASCKVDEEKLAAWLKRVYPQVKKELEDNAHSKAFRGYKLSTDASDTSCKLVQTVNVSANVKDPTIGSQISALSWNSTNHSLAVSCIYKHTSWCYHEGVVLVYSLNYDDTLPTSPKVKLTTETCVTSLEFHSLLPAVLAAGLFSGRIIIWNLQKEEEQLIACVEAHTDGITGLSWISDINSPKNVILASSGLDGLLSLWNFNITESSLIIKERHQIRSQRFPKDSKEEIVKKVTRGIVCFDFSKHSPEMFLVGAEGGLVVQCSLIGTTNLKGDTTDAHLLDPVYKYYDSHKGEVNSVSFSPNRKDMFLTSGSDSEIRIYMIDQEEPARVIFLKQSLNCVAWVPYEERIICGCGKSGVIEIFQLVKGRAVEKTVKDKIKLEVLTHIEINKTKSNMVAVGTENGNIQMWRVPWTLFGNTASV